MKKKKMFLILSSMMIGPAGYVYAEFNGYPLEACGGEEGSGRIYEGQVQYGCCGSALAEIICRRAEPCGSALGGGELFIRSRDKEPKEGSAGTGGIGKTMVLSLPAISLSISRAWKI